jgi:hypothetical protein
MKNESACKVSAFKKIKKAATTVRRFQQRLFINIFQKRTGILGNIIINSGYLRKYKLLKY